MKLPLMAALAALTFWGCSSQSGNTRPDNSAAVGSSATGGSGQAGSDEAREQAIDDQESQESAGEAGNVVDNERRDRMDAPTVYDGEATGGSGTDTTVTTEDGEKWDVMEEPGGANEPRTPETQDATGGSGGEGHDDSNADSDDSGGL